MRKREYVEIHGGFVRLYADGEVTHFDGDICIWQSGWGVWATQSALGDDERKLIAWRKAVSRG